MSLQKSISVAILVLAISPTFAATNYRLYEKSSVITENLHYYEHLLSQGQSKEINQLLDRINFVYHLPVDQCGNPSDIFQTAYEWAYSYNGLNYLSSKAEVFAKRISITLCPAKYLSTFQDSYQYAYGYKGLNKLSSKAVEFADKIGVYEQSHYYPQTTLSCFKGKYDFAYNKMHKTSSAAEQFATEACLP